MKATAFYCRVSTDEQTPESQLLKMQSFFDRQPYKNDPTIEFVEKGVSGSKVAPADRPKFGELLEMCRKGEIQRILVLRIDRLCRNLVDLFEIIEVLKKLHVDVVFTEQNIQTEGAIGRMYLGMLGLLAEFEANLISDRVREGISAAREKGGRIGRKRKFYDTETILAVVERMRDDEPLTNIAESKGLSYRRLQQELKTIEKEIGLPLKNQAVDDQLITDAIELLRQR